MKAMLLAAGFGTRLKPFTDQHPKALARVNDRTLLEHNIRYLQRHGIRDVIVNVHHFADQIEDALRDNNGYGSNVVISDERRAVLETGGGVQHAAWYFAGQSSFVVMNVDVLTNLDLGRMIQAHTDAGAAATLAVMQRPSSRHLVFDGDMRLCGWQHNGTGERRIVRPTDYLRAFAFSGIQVLSPVILDMPFKGKFSLVDVYLHFAATHLLKGYEHTGDLFVDAGKPESLERAATLFP
jgi:MurNAc alpha-1-phosphate uridylyltransferase